MAIASDLAAQGRYHWRDPGKWAPLSGLWTISEGSCKYDGPADRDAAQSPQLCLNEVRLTDGGIRVNARLTRSENTTAGVFFGYRSSDNPYYIASIGAFNRAYSVSQYVPGSGIISLAGAGSIQNLRDEHAYELDVTVSSQQCRLSVDDVEVLDVVLPSPLGGTGWGLFAWDDAAVAFDGIQLHAAAPRLFVVMPFKEPYDSLYEQVIEPVAEKALGFHVTRVDRVFGPGIVLEDIRRNIQASHVVVAEVSEPNPNVFYEVGYAHALNKPVLLLRRRNTSDEQRVDELPFDIRAYRVIFYDDSIGGKREVEELLRKNLEAVLR